MDIDSIIINEIVKGGYLNLFKIPEKELQTQETKLRKEYTNQEKQLAKDISISNSLDNIIFYGSGSYASQNHPSDIDLMEQLIYVGSSDDAKDEYYQKLIKMLDRINEKGYCMTEMKCGFDSRFDIYIGQFENGIYSYRNGSIKDMKYEIKQIKHLLDPVDYRFIITSLHESITQDEFDKVKFILRKGLILRWTEKDIRKGYLMSNGKKFYFIDQISNYETLNRDKVITKYDIIAYVNNKFMEVTNNTFILAVKTKKDKEELKKFIDKKGIIKTNKIDYEAVNLNKMDDFFKNVVATLKESIEQLYFNKMYQNKMKYLKRMWALARFTEDYKMVDKLLTFLRSDIGFLYEIKSELDAIQNYVNCGELSKEKFKTIFKNSMDGIKYKLSKIIDFNYADESDKIFKLIDDMVSKFSKKKILDNVDKIMDILKGSINEYANKYMELYDIDEPKRKYLPDPPQYSIED